MNTFRLYSNEYAVPRGHDYPPEPPHFCYQPNAHRLYSAIGEPCCCKQEFGLNNLDWLRLLARDTGENEEVLIKELKATIEELE